jgi:hypothetical protein
MGPNYYTDDAAYLRSVQRQPSTACTYHNYLRLSLNAFSMSMLHRQPIVAFRYLFNIVVMLMCETSASKNETNCMQRVSALLHFTAAAVHVK